MHRKMNKESSVRPVKALRVLLLVERPTWTRKIEIEKGRATMVHILHPRSKRKKYRNDIVRLDILGMSL